MKYILFLFSLMLVFQNTVYPANADTSLSAQAPKVYIDGSRFDSDYVRTEITFVNYVIDRKEADIHILITRQRTGSGGLEYTLSFFGQNTFAAKNDTIVFTTTQDDTYDFIRAKMVKYIKIGLMQYVARTALADEISISFARNGEAIIPEDSWDYWVIRTRVNGNYKGEESSDQLTLRGDITASRVTENWKIKLDLDLDYTEENYDIDDEKINSVRKDYDFDVLLVKSLSAHWSAGSFAKISTNTYTNEEFAYSLNPAIEYNFFPYSESTRRELRFGYSIGYQFVDYEEETIYDKTSERLLRQIFSIELDIKQPWGRIDTRLTASHYFHDFDKNNLSLRNNLSFKLFKGFSFSLYGGASLIHDQLSLPKSDITTEEVLLRRRQLETQFSYWGGIGLEFTFGSIYNNIVNSRFEN